VADELFAVAVHSRATDYRYAERDGCSVRMEATTLPEHIADRCRALARSLELPFCGIDLRVNGGQYYCFEVNPSPAYSYYEMSGERSIADALVAYLAGDSVAGGAR
jgi:glutathione synthase/RimK-type ligase-like ATP-grasp enzyme